MLNKRIRSHCALARTQNACIHDRAGTRHPERPSLHKPSAVRKTKEMDVSADSLVTHRRWKIQPLKLQVLELKRARIKPQSSGNVSLSPRNWLKR
jgi:hypothetical protein